MATGKFVEFFVGRIANKRTRAVYARAAGQFLGWCEGRGLLPRGGLAAPRRRLLARCQPGPPGEPRRGRPGGRSTSSPRGRRRVAPRNLRLRQGTAQEPRPDPARRGTVQRRRRRPAARSGAELQDCPRSRNHDHRHVAQAPGDATLGHLTLDASGGTASPPLEELARVDRSHRRSDDAHVVPGASRP